MRGTTTWKRALVGGVALAIAAACAGPTMGEIGDAMIDAGRALSDAGDAMTADAAATDAPSGDGPSSDGAPGDDAAPSDDASSDGATPTPRSIIAACDHVYTRTQTTVATLSFETQTTTSTTTEWRAEVAVPGLSTASGAALPRVWVRQCDRDLVHFGPTTPACPCPTSSGSVTYTCTCTGAAASTPACSANAYATFDDGMIYVPCGSRYQSHTTIDRDAGSGFAPPPDTDSGQRYMQVAIEIE